MGLALSEPNLLWKRTDSCNFVLHDWPFRPVVNYLLRMIKNWMPFFQKSLYSKHIVELYSEQSWIKSDPNNVSFKTS